jgi:TnpA family transposase
MPNKIVKLLTPTELLDLYGIPILNDLERQEYFTFSPPEIKVLESFSGPKEAVYFAVCLVFFKIKKTLVEFNYQEITAERQHIMQVYFPKKAFPKSLPPEYTKTRIKNKVLDLCGYQRFTGKVESKIKLKLLQAAPNHPRQRQLGKELLNVLVQERAEIPGYTILQGIVSEVWNDENKRVSQSYLRYTNSNQRATVLTLLKKTDDLHHIISIKQDMKGFNTHELWKELEKHSQLTPIFEIAKVVLPKLGLPAATISYYASLVYYYDGSGLKQLNDHTVGLYLLCYVFTRYQTLNDNLLEAFKKRTLDYKKKATEHANSQVLKYLDLIKDARQRVSSLLITIKNDSDPTYILKKDIYKYIPEDELLSTAQLLVNESFNKDLLFWQYIDAMEDSIKINLRKLFLSMDFVITHNDDLKKVVDYVKEHLIKEDFEKCSISSLPQAWIGKNYKDHIIHKDHVFYNRFEFLMYMHMAHHLASNKLTLKYSFKYKKVEDDLFEKQRWKKDKKRILKKLNYQKVIAPIQKTLEGKKALLTPLYKTVNDAITKGENSFIQIKNNKNGERGWRLSPLESIPNLNDSVLSELNQRSIVDIMRFVEHKTQFCRVFEPMLPKSKKGEQNADEIMAVILANAIRLGARKIATISDLKESALVSAEASYIRVETLRSAVDQVNNEVAKLPIYKEWYINSIVHGSLDGLKLGVKYRNSKARGSPKYFPDGAGVSSYNEIVNSLSITGLLIGSHEYEGNFTFEMVHHQNTSDIKPTHISTDKHGMNSLNFGLFDLTDLIFCPRIPKPHRETLWGFGSPKDYEGMLIKPTKFIDEALLHEEWDNIQRLIASILTGEATPSVVIRKLSSKDYTSNTKKAFVQYNNIVRSQFILTYVHNEPFRRSIMHALNRGEAYNNLYRGISLLNNGELRGKSEIEMEIWNQCTRCQGRNKTLPDGGVKLYHWGIL